MVKKTFALAEVKGGEPSEEHPSGEFLVVMSTDSLDRDGEVIVKGAFDPLPESIPVHAFHDFTDPIGRAVPGYDETGRLVGRGFFASTTRAQEVRQLVADGVIGHTSVGFMAADREERDGVPHIKSGELLEVSFVSVPSNRDAAVLMAKTYEGKAGARNSSKDAERLQAAHDLLVENGATCSHDTPPADEPAPKNFPAPEVEEKSTATPQDTTDAPGAEEPEGARGDDLALRARAVALAAASA